MKREMPRAIARRQRDGWRVVRRQRAFRRVESPDEDLVEPEIGGKDEAPRRVRFDHVRVRAIVAADGKAARQERSRLRRPDRALMAPDISRRPELAVRLDRQHRDRPAAVVGDQRVLPCRMNAHVGRPRPFRADGVEQRQSAGCAIDCVDAHRFRSRCREPQPRSPSRGASASRSKASHEGLAAVLTTSRCGERAGRRVHFQQVNALSPARTRPVRCRSRGRRRFAVMLVARARRAAQAPPGWRPPV